MCSFTVLGGSGGSENQSVSGVTIICLTQCNTSPSHRVDQVVDCGLWNVCPLLFNGCAKFLDIGRNWNSSCPGGWSQTILEVKMLDVEVLGWCGYSWSAIVRPVGCTAKFSETLMVEK